ncbi:hypothetical protein Pcinc_009255 [Petrolisthes cinctipes]|uniref:Uncharacterized protein n=1 Tax=Petrolisthes cinctipes TaxID=88211 RepID=A0AAE1GBM6_PETCI|nr:hypothetical protein Pcinc_009255 [Petrolisthes cinctipes]
MERICECHNQGLQYAEFIVQDIEL